MVAMDSSRRSEPQQFKSITVLRRPVFVGSKPKENGDLGEDKNRLNGQTDQIVYIDW
jgi:hypothetical protein